MKRSSALASGPIVAVPVVRVRIAYRAWSAIVATAWSLLALGPYIDLDSYGVEAYRTASAIPWSWWSAGWGLGAVACFSSAAWGRRFSWVWSSFLVLAPAALWVWCLYWQRFASGTAFPPAALVAWSMLLVGPAFVFVVSRDHAFEVVAKPIVDRRKIDREQRRKTER